MTQKPLDDVFTNFSDWRGDFTNMMYRWAGVLSVSTTSRGVFMDDARKLAFLEKYTGIDWDSVLGSSAPEQLVSKQIVHDAFI